MADDIAKRLAAVAFYARESIQSIRRLLKIAELYPEKLCVDDWVHSETTLQWLLAMLAPECPDEDPHGGAIPLMNRERYRE